jgi:hypothetical protein
LNNFCSCASWWRCWRLIRRGRGMESSDLVEARRTAVRSVKGGRWRARGGEVGEWAELYAVDEIMSRAELLSMHLFIFLLFGKIINALSFASHWQTCYSVVSTFSRS